MRIRYKRTSRTGQCLTECPNRRKTISTGSIRVGSFSCTEGCGYFVCRQEIGDELAAEVECSFPEKSE